MDIKSIESIDSIDDMKEVLSEMASTISDVQSKSVRVVTKEDQAREEKEARKELVRKFLNNAPAKSNLGAYAKQLDLGNSSSAIEEQLSRDIIELAILNTAFLKAIGNQTVSSTDFRQLVLSVRPSVAQTGEQDGTTTAVGETSTQTYTEINALFGKIYAEPKLTHEIIRDMHINLEAELMRLIAEEWSFKLIDMLLNGNGTKTNGIQNLRGLLNFRVDKANSFAESLKEDGVRDADHYQVIKSGVANALGTDSDSIQDFLTDVQVALPQKYHQNAAWYMNVRTFAVLKKLRTADGFPVIEFGSFAMSGAAWEQGYVLLGRPVVIIDQFPDVTADETPIVYGDLKAAFKMVPLAESNHYIVDEITTKGAKSIYLDQRFGEIIGNSDAVRIALCAV